MFSNGSSPDTMAPVITLGYEAIVLSAISAWGILGNALVCLAIRRDKNLQTRTNYFLCSLTVADLLVCMIVMPLAIVIQVYEGVWPYSPTLCVCFSWLDVYLCTASILHMSAISVDRYIGIARPLRSRSVNTSFVLSLKIMSVWTFSLVVSLPLLILSAINTNTVYSSATASCQINHTSFQIYGSLVGFLLPFLVFSIMFVRTVRLLKRQAQMCAANAHEELAAAMKGKQRYMIRRSTATSSHFQRNSIPSTLDEKQSRSASLTCLYTKGGSISTIQPRKRSRAFKNLSNKPQRTPTLLRSRQLNCGSNPVLSYFHKRVRKLGYVSSDSYSNRLPHRKLGTQVSDEDQQQIIRSVSLPDDRGETKRETTYGRFILRKRRRLGEKAAQLRQMAKEVAYEQKATKVLGVVFFCFFFCWVPFFAANITLSLCEDRCQALPAEVGTLLLWLGYFSSTLNPVIYTVFNRSFRRSFLRTLSCQTLGKSPRKARATHKEKSSKYRRGENGMVKEILMTHRDSTSKQAGKESPTLSPVNHSSGQSRTTEL